MKIVSSSNFLTLDLGKSSSDFANSILGSHGIGYWVMQDTSQNRTKWSVLPAIPFNETTLKFLDEEEEKKKRLREYLRVVLEIVPEVQIVTQKGGRINWKQGILPYTSGYLLALKDSVPFRIATPEKIEELHPEQQKVEIDLARLAGQFENILEGMRVEVIRPGRSAGVTGIDITELGRVDPPEKPPSVAPVDREPPQGPPRPAIVSSGQAFPWITPNPEPVVQKETFDVEVALKFTPSADSQGSVRLPMQPGTFTLDVHLLFEDQSVWDTLEFNWTDGTTRPAKFPSLTAPKYKGSADRPDFRMIRANFYLNNRWCGEGLKNLEILPQSGAPQASEIPAPAQPEWLKYLNVLSTDVAPPDLLVRIQEIDRDKYQWSFLSPHKNFKQGPVEDYRTLLKDGAERYVKSNFEPLSKGTLNDLTMERLEGTCKQIYDNTPQAFKDVYWDLYHAAQKDSKIKLETIQFVSDEPFVPWEIMQVADEARGPGIDAEILSVRHAAGRWMASESCHMRSSISLQEMAIFASDYNSVATVTTKLKWAEQEAQDLLAEYHDKPKATRYKLLSKDLVHFLKEGKAQVVHFSCHGRMDQQTPSLSTLMLEDDQLNFVPAVVTTQANQRGIGSQHPLVFLNACQVGGTGEGLTFVTGWPQAFLTMGASAVIAPLWSVGDQSAREIAEQFYKLVISNSPISLGAALQSVRKHFKETKQITYLAYLLYGDPTALISVD